jgi:hypothetical protein
MLKALEQNSSILNPKLMYNQGQELLFKINCTQKNAAT